MTSTSEQEDGTMRVIHGVLAIVVVTLVACDNKPQAVQAPAPGAGGRMGGMPMTMQGMQMMPMVRAHLDSLATMPPTQMAAMMAAHQDLMSRMMDAMGADMGGMHMEPDAAWTALSDSLRQDLADLPGRSGAALQARMQAHVGRMQRMMAMHAGMMKM
jgi:hypothetical protein